MPTLIILTYRKKKLNLFFALTKKKKCVRRSIREKGCSHSECLVVRMPSEQLLNLGGSINNKTITGNHNKQGNKHFETMLETFQACCEGYYRGTLPFFHSVTTRMSFQAAHAHDAGTLGQALVSQNKQPKAPSQSLYLTCVCLLHLTPNRQQLYLHPVTPVTPTCNKVSC